LIAIANKLNSSFKTNLVGRVGGEEFIGVIDKLENLSVFDFCENIRKEIVDLPIKFQDHNIKVTMSGGLASSTEIENLEDLINLADERLYKAKEGGRNQIIFQ
jgi:diguanylate cyclase (GGDEF)-like protein